MERNDKKINSDATISDKTLRKSIEFQRIGNRAVHRAQEENRRLNIPNWYSIGGEIVSDLDIKNKNKKDK